MLTYITDLLTIAIDGFDESLQDVPAHQLVLATAALYFLWQRLPDLTQTYRARHNTTYKQKVLDAVYGIAKKLPFVPTILNKELDKNLHSTMEKLTTQRANMVLQAQMPAEGVSVLRILNEFGINPEDCTFNFTSINDGDPERESTVQHGDGQDSGALYAVYPIELSELLQKIYAATALTNPLHDKWPRISAMQAEVINWCQNLFHGSEEGYGLITHGGTSSIIEAMAAYVLHARATGIHSPEIVVPETAHAAFKKAADLTGAKLITVPVDKKTGAVSATEMRKYISKNTAVMVGSAPSFMNGINDPIAELGTLAQEKNIPFHVDACLGGFLTAFLDTTSAPMDFRVPGVTSISADTHKYGLCPKGTSVCLFSKDSPATSVHAALNWPGGLYATPGIIDGSTSGARIAEIYTVLSYYGRQKYQDIAQRIVTLRQSIQEKVAVIDGISIYGNPQWSVLGFCSDHLNPHAIADELEKRGWKLSLLQNPDGFHLCLTHVHTLVEGFADQFAHDLQAAVTAVKSAPPNRKPSGNVKVYGAIGMLPTLIQKMICDQYQKARLRVGFFT